MFRQFDSNLVYLDELGATRVSTRWDLSCLAPAGLAPQAASAAASASSPSRPSRPIKMPKLPQPLWSSRSPCTRLHFQLSRCWNKCTSPATNPRNDSRQTMTRPYKTYIILYYIVLYYTIIYYSYLVTVSLIEPPCWPCQASFVILRHTIQIQKGTILRQTALGRMQQAHQWLTLLTHG